MPIIAISLGCAWRYVAAWNEDGDRSAIGSKCDDEVFQGATVRYASAVPRFKHLPIAEGQVRIHRYIVFAIAMNTENNACFRFRVLAIYTTGACRSQYTLRGPESLNPIGECKMNAKHFGEQL